MRKSELLNCKYRELFATFADFLIVEPPWAIGSTRKRHVEKEKRAMKMRSVLTLALFCTALAPAVAKAEDQQNQNENQAACMSDAMTVCAQYIPDRQRVAGCLISNRNRVSAPCRAQLAHWHG
jgi:hypothetical protein